MVVMLECGSEIIIDNNKLSDSEYIKEFCDNSKLSFKNKMELLRKLFRK